MTDTNTVTVERPRFTRGSAVKPSSTRPRPSHIKPGVDLAKGKHRTGPYSRWLTEGRGYNGSSREGRFLNACRKELEDHLGGRDHITVGQKILIERICYLRLRAAFFDEQFLDEGKALGELDYRVYMAISNSLVRATRELGVGKRPNGTTSSYHRILRELEDAAK